MQLFPFQGKIVGRCKSFALQSLPSLDLQIGSIFVHRMPRILRQRKLIITLAGRWLSFCVIISINVNFQAFLPSKQYYKLRQLISSFSSVPAHYIRFPKSIVILIKAKFLLEVLMQSLTPVKFVQVFCIELLYQIDGVIKTWFVMW